MGGTLSGGKKAAAKNKAGDPEFYIKIGAAGGRKSRHGGFGAGDAGRERARIYGSLGGQLGAQIRWGGGLTEKQRKRIHDRFKANLEANYAHLLKVHEGANR